MDTSKPLIVSDINDVPSLLRGRFQQYGYLHFKGAVAADKCQYLLSSFLKQLHPHVVFDKSQQLPILKGAPFFETDPIWDEVYPNIQSIYEFHQFFHQNDIRHLMELVTDDKVFVYPMKMARIATPKKVGYETPPHQDAHSHHAGPTMAGIWVALHDVQKGMGRLKILPQSHKQGVRPVLEAEGVGGVQCEVFDHEKNWHVSDMEQGDVIIFHSCCVHRAEANTTQSIVRLSVDTRFCNYGAPVFCTNLEPHHGWRIEGLGWEQIYKSWVDKRLQYYWQDYPNAFSVFGEKALGY